MPLLLLMLLGSTRGGGEEVKSKTFEGWSRSQSVKPSNPPTNITSPGVWSINLGGLGCTRLTVFQVCGHSILCPGLDHHDLPLLRVSETTSCLLGV